MAETSTRLGRVSLVPRGAYDAAAVYNRLDIVEHEGTGYLVLADGTTGVPPEAGPVYMLLSARGGRGDPGAPGTPGATGETGPQGETGTGVQSIERTAGDGSPGTTDTYTITMTDGSTAVFTVYNGADGTSFTVLGRYDTLDELTSDHPTGGEGEAWAVGSAEDNDIYLWNVNTQTWDNIGTLQGPPGPSGPAAGFGEVSAEVDGEISSETNPPGVVVTASGPDTAKNLHFSFQNLRGKTGPQGPEGPLGPAGADGADGKSAYQQAVDGGYTGTEAQFNAILATGPWLPLSGGTVNGTISLSGRYILNVGGFTFKVSEFLGNYMNNEILLASDNTYQFYGKNDGGTRPNANLAKLEIAYPEANDHAANKKYVDDQVGDIASILDSINGEVV